MSSAIAAKTEPIAYTTKADQAILIFLAIYFENRGIKLSNTSSAYQLESQL